MNSRPHKRSVSRVASFGHAWRGMRCLVASQINARIHVAATVVVVGLGWWLKIAVLEWALLTAMIALVLCAEALNTGIEWVVDLASPEWHELARNAKDVAAAGVLLASLGALVVGMLVLGPKILERLGM